MILQGFTDKELIAELNFRGYRVAKSDLIRTASVESSFSTYDLLKQGENQGFKANIYESLGARLGAFLIESGGVPVIEEIAGPEARKWRANVTVIVDDPKFDWPYELRMKS